MNSSSSTLKMRFVLFISTSCGVCVVFQEFLKRSLWISIMYLKSSLQLLYFVILSC